MTRRKRILAAAMDIHRGRVKFSCWALHDHEMSSSPYEDLFIPATDLDVRFSDQLVEAGLPNLREWRVLALCFYAAMQEECDE